MSGVSGVAGRLTGGLVAALVLAKCAILDDRRISWTRRALLLRRMICGGVLRSAVKRCVLREAEFSLIPAGVVARTGATESMVRGCFLIYLRCKVRDFWVPL